MRPAAGLLAALCLAGCAALPSPPLGGAAAAVGAPALAAPPEPPAADVEPLLLKADAALSAAERGASGDLAAYFEGPALALEQRRLDAMRRRGESREERDVSRRLVHGAAGPAGPEAVLELRGQGRLVGPGRPAPSWSSFVRQWWTRLAWSGGAWKIVEEHDLPPAQWWPS